MNIFEKMELIEEKIESLNAADLSSLGCLGQCYKDDPKCGACVFKDKCKAAYESTMASIERKLDVKKPVEKSADVRVSEPKGEAATTDTTSELPPDYEKLKVITRGADQPDWASIITDVLAEKPDFKEMVDVMKRHMGEKRYGSIYIYRKCLCRRLEEQGYIEPTDDGKVKTITWIK